jgi:hypothetical protein
LGGEGIVCGYTAVREVAGGDCCVSP